eukprot:Nitzschia sp. Nitz4//scaffold140_size61219//26573//29005//NITZ4_006439-RA/size61219-augustus-gene-0.63-mRNA-1//-1//CDS//3329536224//1795//frame0
MDRQLLSRATDNSDAPTPGYMYLDIAKNAASNPATCSEVAKFLTNRLSSRQNHNVKYKCLKIISKTCVSPYLKGQFKRSLAQDPNAMTAIKEALQFRGPPDPVRGDEPYERVRAAAKEALDAVYSDTPVDAGPSTSYASVSSSYAPNPHTASSYGPSAGAAAGGARRMDGIGNPMFSDPRMTGGPGGMGPGNIGNMTIKDVVNEAKDTVIGMIRDPLARNTNVQVQAGSMPRPGGGYGGPSPYSNPPGRNELMQQTGGQWTMASNRGAGAVAPPPNYANDSAYYKSRDNNNAYAWAQKGAGAPSGVGGSWASAAPAPSIASQARQPYEQHHQATPSITVTQTPGAAPAYPSQGGGAVSDGSYEKQLIMELCPPGGMKAEPPPDKLNQFCRSVPNLNADLVCPTLLDCLEEGQPWIIRAKALWVIEACIKYGQRPGAASNAYADFFHTCSGEVAPLANHNRAQIRDPAKRVLNLLGVATPAAGAAPIAAAPAPMAAPAPAPVAAMPNLLDFDEPEPEEPPTPPSAPPPVAPPAPVDTGASLFGGLNVSSPVGAPPSQPPPPPPATASSAPPPPPSSGNLLGDFLQDAAPTPATDSSLFGDMAVKGTPVPAPASDASVDQAASMFGDLMVKGAETPKEAAPAPAAGSAFGFINDSAPKQEAPVAPAPPGATSRASYDPLQNMTPNTAQKMMQVSPEQMQAMAYQQMLMQQQMQMAQLMAMQRGGAGGGMMMPTPMPGVMQGAGGANRTSMAFRDQPVRREDKQFNFIQDAVTKEKKK